MGIAMKTHDDTPEFNAFLTVSAALTGYSSAELQRHRMRRRILASVPASVARRDP